MEFGMPTLIEHDNLEESAKLCHDLGLNFIELNMNLPQYQVEELEKTEYFHDIAQRYGIYYTIHLDENLNPCDFNNAIANAYVDTVLNTIEIAKKLKVPLLNMHLNRGVYFTLPNEKIYLFNKFNTDFMKKITTFKVLCEKAISDSNIHISIENTNGYLPFQKKAIDLLLDSDVFTLTWDIGHSHTANNIDEEYIRMHQDKLRHFHIHDAISKSNHLILGTGEIDLQERLQLAKDNNCRCVLETKTVEALKQSVEWLSNHDNGGIYCTGKS